MTTGIDTMDDSPMSGSLTARIAVVEATVSAQTEKLNELHQDVREIKVGLFGDKLKDPQKKGLIEQVLYEQQKVDERHTKEDKILASVCRGFAWSFGIALATVIGYYTQQTVTRTPVDRGRVERHIEHRATVPRDVSTEDPDARR